MSYVIYEKATNKIVAVNEVPKIDVFGANYDQLAVTDKTITPETHKVEGNNCVLKTSADLAVDEEARKDQRSDLASLSEMDRAVYKAIFKTINDVISGAQTTPVTLAEWKQKIKSEL